MIEGNIIGRSFLKKKKNEVIKKFGEPYKGSPIC